MRQDNRKRVGRRSKADEARAIAREQIGRLETLRAETVIAIEKLTGKLAGIDAAIAAIEASR